MANCRNHPTVAAEPGTNFCKPCNDKHKANKGTQKEPQFEVKITYKHYPSDTLNANKLLAVRFVLTITNKDKVKAGCPVMVMKNGLEQKALDATGTAKVDIGATNNWGQTTFDLGLTEKELGKNIELEVQARVSETFGTKTIEGIGFETIRFTAPTLAEGKKSAAKKEKCRHCGGTKRCENDEVGKVKCSCEACLKADGTKDQLATVSCSYCK